ncbi:OmpA family protein [Hymenobacter latericus]|uniref:OmpA family protein n=1 Tax=Hymenobacter sp. YIM 151858-1 TaxID=2987688 RepID=UPI00222656B4|nr:OmpA family protein [Hymenobacter sp. YIM 151858-1]UYZ57696.1 OmpA family protein [Hymenobacter sp. YIM 151858-1]
MSQNVLEEVLACFTAPAVSQVSTVVGESETGVRKALPKVIPLVLSSLIKLAEQVGGSEVIWTMAHDAHRADVQTDVLAAENESSPAHRGQQLIRSLLTENNHRRVGEIAHETGIRHAAVERLLGIVAPVMLGVLGEYATRQPLDAPALGRWLHAQRNSVSGLLIADKESSLATQTAPEPRRPLPPVHEPVAAHEGIPQRQWLWPALLVLLAVLTGFFLGQNRTAPLASLPPANAYTAGLGATDEPAAQEARPARSAANLVADNEVPTTASGRYDAASENYIYDTGQPVQLTLAGGTTYTVGANSTENRLYRFLVDANVQVDSVNRTKGWINFDRVYFDARKASLTDESMAQLRNVADILKSFPRSRVKIGGYTDTTGTFLQNLRLSEERATVAMAALIDLGVPANRIEAKGYGQKYPVASNETPVGRALNRRISIRVTQK